MTYARPFGPAALALLLCCWSPGRATADDRGAVASGNWSDPATWTGGVAPGANDRAYIGTTINPGGAASAATVSLTASQAAYEVYLGYGSGSSGTLQLGNFNLTTQRLYLGYQGGTGTVLRGTGTLSIADRLTVDMGNSFTFAAGDVAANLTLQNGGQATTAVTGNLTTGVSVSGSGSRLTLGADLSVGQNVALTGGGVLDAQGHAVAAGSRVILDATSQLLNRGALTASYELDVTGQPFALTAADRVVGFSLSGTAATTSLGAGVAVSSLILSGGATASTATVGNVSYGVSVDGSGSKLTLGANLSVSNVLSVSNGGTLNAQGFNIAATSGVQIGTSGSTAPVLQNLGTVTTTGGYTQAGGSSVTLGAGDSSFGSLALSGNSTLTVQLLSGAAGRLTVTGTSSSAIGIEAGSHLALTLDGGQPGYALRWANPSGGDHVADLAGLIGSGAITISQTNGAQYMIGSDGSYTSLFVPVPEPAPLLLAAVGGLGLVRAVRRRAGRGWCGRAVRRLQPS